MRSQIDVRICLRVRERRDVDLILGEGSLTAGWHAHSLTQPGAFLISAPELTVPERARGYLITDDQSPHTPPGTRAARQPLTAETDPTHGYGQPGPGGGEGPVGALWAALCGAPADGLPVWVLISACGKSRSWVYGRLQQLAAVRDSTADTNACRRLCGVNPAGMPAVRARALNACR